MHLVVTQRLQPCRCSVGRHVWGELRCPASGHTRAGPEALEPCKSRTSRAFLEHRQAHAAQAHLRLPWALPRVHLYLSGTAARRSTSGGSSSATASAGVGCDSPDQLTCAAQGGQQCQDTWYAGRLLSWLL